MSTGTIKTDLLAVKDYLLLKSNEIFRIPEYQRAYEWEEEQCERLWDDIMDFIDQKRDNYFFGSIIINCKEDGNVYDLIDGQQRTTTFMLLLKAILIIVNDKIKGLYDKKDEKDTKETFRKLRGVRRDIIKILYQVDDSKFDDDCPSDADKSIYEQCKILENKSSREKYKNELILILKGWDSGEIESTATKIKGGKKPYTKYFNNFKFFYKKLTDLSKESEINFADKMRKLLDQCEIIKIRSTNEDEAITMFNSLNSKGLPLYDADIIHAQLLTKARDGGKENDFNKAWSTLEQLLSEYENNGIIENIDNLLLQYMYYQRTIEAKTMNKVVDSTTPGVRKYFMDLNKSLLEKPIEFVNDLIYLVCMWGSIYEFDITKILYKFNKNFKLFLATYLFRFKNEFEYDSWKAKNDSDFVYKNKSCIEKIIRCFIRLFAILDISNYSYSTKQFKSFLFNEETQLLVADENTIENDFNTHINSIEMFDKDDLDFQIKNKYNKNALVYLNELLYAEQNGEKFSFAEKCDIEHIMCQCGKNTDAIRKDAKLSDDEFNTYLNKLGNKILLEIPINRGIGNGWFRVKLNGNSNIKGYKDSNYPIAKSLYVKYGNDKSEINLWVKDKIDEATNEAADRIIKFIFQKQSSKIVKVVYHTADTFTGCRKIILENCDMSLIEEITKDWRDNYERRDVMDGAYWKVKIYYNDGRQKLIKGHFDAPESFGKFIEFVEKNGKQVEASFLDINL